MSYDSDDQFLTSADLEMIGGRDEGNRQDTSPMWNRCFEWNGNQCFIYNHTRLCIHRMELNEIVENPVLEVGVVQGWKYWLPTAVRTGPPIHQNMYFKTDGKVASWLPIYFSPDSTGLPHFIGWMLVLFKSTKNRMKGLLKTIRTVAKDYLPKVSGNLHLLLGTELCKVERDYSKDLPNLARLDDEFWTVLPRGRIDKTKHCHCKECGASSKAICIDFIPAKAG